MIQWERKSTEIYASKQKRRSCIPYLSASGGDGGGSTWIFHPPGGVSKGVCSSMNLSFFPGI